MPRGVFKRKRRKQTREPNLKKDLLKAAKHHRQLLTAITNLARKI